MVGGIVVVIALIQQQPGPYRLIGLVAVHRPLVEARHAQHQRSDDDRGNRRPT